MNKQNKANQVSIIMPMRNSSTTVLNSLRSLINQEYPIKEIIIIDNASEDNSVKIVNDFSKLSKIPIALIVRKKNMGVGANFNYGVKIAKSEIIVLMHSDCSLPTENELAKLIKPLVQDASAVAAYPTIFLLESIWRNYDFWEKYFFARQVGTSIAGFTTKFDAVRRDTYLKLGGFDMENFGVGGEDADLHNRLNSVGKVVSSQAKVTHLHYLGQGYSFGKLLVKQRVYARVYGRLMRIRGISIIKNGLIFLVKPTLAILPFFPPLRDLGIILIVLYSFLYTKKMFMTKSTLTDSRIIILPFLNIFSLYSETFWIIESFLFGKNKIE